MGNIQIGSMSWERSGKPGRFSFFRRAHLLTTPKGRWYFLRKPCALRGGCGSCRSLMDNVTFRWAAAIVHAVGKELPIWKPLLWAGNSPTHSAACLRKSAAGSFVAVMDASCFVTYPFSFLRKRNKKDGEDEWQSIIWKQKWSAVVREEVQLQLLLT